MVISRYTICVESDGEHLLFNAANGAFAALDDQTWKQSGLESATVSGVDREEVCIDDQAMAGQLAEAGFLVDLDPEQELAVQQERFDVSRASKDSLTLSFIPTYACNYRCPYCYEQGHNSVKGKMDARTMDAVCAFVEKIHDRDGFGNLSVQWYGGDPSLALDVVEALSSRLTKWCEDHGVSYDALMLTNANLIDDEAAALIARNGISHVILTIDGPEELHNVRRVAADGSNSYAKNIQAARYLRAYGIRLTASMNVDKVNWELYPKMRDKLAREEGIELTPGKLCDYGHFYGQKPFAAPAFDLFTHQEFAKARLELFQRESHTAAEIREMLRPVPRFCSGQLDNYYVIDLLGDVYNCDGWVGDTSYVRFNLFEDESTWKLEDVSHDATRNSQCKACELLPICQGNCDWERRCNGMPCHPLKYTIDGYLRLYRKCFDESARGYTLLARPFEPEEIAAI